MQVLRTRIKDNASRDKEAAAKKMARAQKSNQDGPAPMLKTASRGLSYLLKSTQSKDDEAPTEDDVDSKIKDILSRCDLNGDGLISYDGTSTILLFISREKVLFFDDVFIFVRLRRILNSNDGKRCIFSPDLRGTWRRCLTLSKRG